MFVRAVEQVAAPKLVNGVRPILRLPFRSSDDRQYTLSSRLGFTGAAKLLQWLPSSARRRLMTVLLANCNGIAAVGGAEVASQALG